MVIVDVVKLAGAVVDVVGRDQEQKQSVVSTTISTPPHSAMMTAILMLMPIELACVL